MARSVKAVNEEVGASKKAVPKTRAKKKGDLVTFRSPHPGLSVIVKECKRIDYGAGQYHIEPPEIAEFENMGSYGECKCDPNVAVILRQKSKEREALGLPLKYTEV
jgi:hypothetical protein